MMRRNMLAASCLQPGVWAVPKQYARNAKDNESAFIIGCHRKPYDCSAR